ncbi:hypothetical protein [Natronospira bacteriovora]|uniref:Cellulose biosynthesis protein BcsS n=1 Tax=Natronospira bacteriovora TaxID=3069753 RepID=A0ABU0W8B2_9GAMM|nr:hypothetical protein [Natronospira sp. AB-CW4]MDQ2070236.1 hypothetical protein [Natronospira sp. AB-CW4]
MLLLLPWLILAGAVEASGLDGPRESGLSYEARLQSERLLPLVEGSQRDFNLESASLHLRESVRGGLYGGLLGGLPSLRWRSEDSEDTVRVGGHLFGLSLGGRHPARSPLAMVWEGSYIWTEVGGSLGDGELDLSLRESSARLGVEWWPGTMGMTLGVARQRVSGEEFRSDGDTTRSRSLGWRSDDHAFLELGLDVGAGGWMSIRYLNREPRGTTLLIFGQQF